MKIDPNLSWRTRLWCRPECAAGLLALYTLAVLNAPFWRELIAATTITTNGDWLFLAAVAVAAFALLWCLYGLAAWPRLFKPLSIVLLTIGALASYHTTEFATLFDRHMIANVLETDHAEARDLITPRMLWHVGWMAIIPALLLIASPIAYRPFAAEVRAKLIGGTLLALVIVAAILPFTSTMMPLARENPKLRFTFAPFNVLSGLVAHTKPSAVLAARRLPLQTIAGVKGAAWGARSNKSITVIVVGETARSANFSLNGYGRPTNPSLAAIDGIVSFKQVESCGTATAQSLPCMFSDLGMNRFSAAAAAQRENLTDVLKHAGFSMLWRDNQSGCKGICLRIPSEQTNQRPKEFYKDSDTQDVALLDGLETWINRIESHGVVVLHMMGSHGPAYYKRYDEANAPFQPTCKTAQLSACSHDALLNTYDNTINYTDMILGRLIGTLGAADARGIATAMLYISDHGESLGERGVYLHGLPKALAPKEQTHIPWITWLSPRFRRDNRVDTACLAANNDHRISHDHLFHSVLGLLDIDSPAYNRSLDAYATCRRGEDG